LVSCSKKNLATLVSELFLFSIASPPIRETVDDVIANLARNMFVTAGDTRAARFFLAQCTKTKENAATLGDTEKLEQK
jgi:hypothetical protein